MCYVTETICASHHDYMIVCLMLNADVMKSELRRFYFFFFRFFKLNWKCSSSSYRSPNHVIFVIIMVMRTGRWWRWEHVWKDNLAILLWGFFFWPYIHSYTLYIRSFYIYITNEGQRLRIAIIIIIRLMMMKQIMFG